LGRQDLGYHRSLVFVAAAGVGNGESVGQRIDDPSSSDCRAYPACWGNGGNKPRGIISVVALNNSGNDLVRGPNDEPLSNFGFAFDVSAVGQTMSTYYGDYIGPVCGSSFATPYVSGLAALLYGKAKYLGPQWPKPAEVKERILFTADKILSLNESRFGRINYARALDFQYDWIEEKPSISCSGGCRKQVAIDRNKQEIIVVTYGTQDGNVPIMDDQIPFKRVRRLTSEGDGLFTVRYLDSAGKLRILEHALISVAKKYNIVTVDNKSFPLDLTSIQEFVACSFSDRCGSQP
jgi:hypothetical protein